MFGLCINIKLFQVMKTYLFKYRLDEFTLSVRAHCIYPAKQVVLSSCSPTPLRQASRSQLAVQGE